MKNLETNNDKSKIKDGIQLDLPLEEISKVESSEDLDITHLGPDDLIKMQVEDPEEYEAFMAEIERQRDLSEIEKAAAISEVEDLAEKNKIKDKMREEELRNLISKAYDEEDDHISDASLEYKRYRDIKLQGGSIKNPKERSDGKNYRSINNPNDLMSPLH
jgi:hypothetical protein